jgi:hypothetical protein
MICVTLARLTSQAGQFSVIADIAPVDHILELDSQSHQARDPRDTPLATGPHPCCRSPSSNGN